MPINLLSARKVETAPAQDKAYWLKDGGSLFLHVQPNGSKLWRYRYRIGGQPQIYAIGKYPEVTLEAARSERDRARDLVKQGVHPRLARKAQVQAQLERNANTFESVARRWMASSSHWTAGYANQIKGYLERDVFPRLGDLPIADVKANHLRAAIKAVEARGAECAAILIRQWSSQIFSYAGGEGLCEHDPTSLLKGVVKRPRVRHHPPLTWAEVPEFLHKLDGWAGYRTTVLALRLMALLFVRTVELRKAKWKEFDLKNATWMIPPERMKMRRPHLVPLSRQALEALQELHGLTGGGEVLFPNYRRPTQVMSATTLNRALERLGFGGRFSSHGFRSTATTLLGLLGYPENRVDLQLAHSKKDSSRAPYDHAKYVASRRIIMQDWADVLDALGRGETVQQVMEGFGPVSQRRSALLQVIERE